LTEERPCVHGHHAGRSTQRTAVIVSVRFKDTRIIMLPRVGRPSAAVSGPTSANSRNSITTGVDGTTIGLAGLALAGPP
jgi:hypothetical protein